MRTSQQVLFLLFIIALALPVYATDTATVSGTNQVNFTPWRMNPAVMTSISDPHPDTSLPQTMRGTQADTQFGRNVVSGFSEASFDLTTSSGVGDFQSVINRINTSGSGSSRVNQLQTQINQNQSQAGYIFDNKFSITSMTDSAGNLIGQANGNFIQTRQDLVSGAVQTTTCTGTFTYDPVNGYTLTSGTAQGQGAGCKTQ